MSGPPSSAFPPSMGPGAQSTHNPPNPSDMVRQIREMRQYYKVAVEADYLKVGYSIDGMERTYSIPFDKAPMSGFHKWLLYGGRVRSMVSGTFLLDMMRGAENMIGRPLSQEEAEAFTFHSGKRMRYGFIGMGVALGAGYAMAARGLKIMKFPFRKAKPLENYDAFPLKRMPLLTGPTARAAWQTTRFNLYAALGIIFLSPIFRSMGESVMGVGLYQDVRTRDTVKAIKGGFDRIRMNRRLPGSAPPSAQQKPVSANSADSQDAYGNDSATMQSYNNDSAFADDTVDTDALSDSTMRQRESNQSSPASYSRKENTYRSQQKAQAQQPSSSSSSSSSDFFFDDQSSYGSNDPDSPAYRGPPQQSSGGSAWSRIRQRGAPSSSSYSRAQDQASSAASPQQQQPTSQADWRAPQSDSRFNARSAPGSGDFETAGDSFSFSSSDQDRALAKNQAQKEFDAMLEQERRESGKGDYTRGSSEAAFTSGDTQRDTRASNTGGSGGAWGRIRGNRNTNDGSNSTTN